MDPFVVLLLLIVSFFSEYMLRNISLQEVKDSAAGYSFVIPLRNRVNRILPYILMFNTLTILKFQKQVEDEVTLGTQCLADDYCLRIKLYWGGIL